MEGVAHQARFAALMTAITRRLPFGLSEVVAPSLVGYLLINLCTFFIDLSLLGLFHGTFRWPIPVAVTLSYGTASVISYVLNRILNFRSHDDVGRQFPRLRGGEREQLPDLRARPHRPAVRRRRLLRALPGHRGLLRGRLPVHACCASWCSAAARAPMGGAGAGGGATEPEPEPGQRRNAPPTADGAPSGGHVSRQSRPGDEPGRFRSRCTTRATASIVSIPYCSDALSSVSTAIR